MFKSFWVSFAVKVNLQIVFEKEIIRNSNIVFGKQVDVDHYDNDAENYEYSEQDAKYGY